MNKSCFVCNARGLAPNNYVGNITSEYEILPQSGKKLIDTINEMLDKTIEVSPADVLCKECYQTTVHYDTLKSKLNLIKFDFADNYNTTQNAKKQTEIPSKAQKKRLVVPASKLQPLPANYQLNFSKLAMSIAGSAKKEQKTEENQKSQNKNTTPNIKIEIPEHSETENRLEGKDSSGENNDITKWTVTTLPKDIFSNNLTENQVNDEENDWSNEQENHDDNGMEIDEDCNVTVVTATSKNGDLIYNADNIKTESNEPSELIVSGLSDLQTLEGVDAENFVLGKIRILNGDDSDGPHTIVVDGDNASILEMMSGQRLVYENGEISFVMEDDENKDNGEDSNDDESQIELQVSGDEETANAIIAAAQEQGGAFIKVESGEMYRVQSVKSKTSNTETYDNVMQIVTKEGKEFRCLLCDKSKENGNACIGKEFKSDAEGIMKHLKCEHAATIYVCQLCGVIMRKRTDYSTHIANHAKKISQESNGISSITKSKLHECDICKRSYNSKTLLQEHMNTHTGSKPYSCPVCMKAFASKYTHQAHLKTHQVRPRPYVCTQCGKSFLSQPNLSQHEKIHSGIKSFVCKICGKAFGTQHNLEVHGVVHSGEKNHECDTCGKTFARRAELMDHIRTHTGERPFGCEICGARFTQRSNLHSHRRATHFDDRRYACDQCTKRFKRRRLLEYHIKASHTGERPLRCGTCHATFVYPEHYKKHIKIHTGEKTYSCEICGKSFNSRDNRNTHRFVHSDKKPYECLACGASYMRKRLLIAHMTVSGHLAESIVVNQPRVTSVNDEGVATVMFLNENDYEHNKSGDSTLKTSSQLKLLNDDKNTSHIDKSEEDEAPKYIITADDLKVGSDNSFIQTISASQLVAGDSNALSEGEGAGGEGVLRLIQVKLPDGKDGWVAIND